MVQIDGGDEGETVGRVAAPGKHGFVGVDLRATDTDATRSSTPTEPATPAPAAHPSVSPSSPPSICTITAVNRAP